MQHLGQRIFCKSIIGNESLNQDSNDNDVRIVNYVKNIWLLTA
jgi:hypothetical protein